jgi:hypothetical protein
VIGFCGELYLFKDFTNPYASNKEKEAKQYIFHGENCMYLEKNNNYIEDGKDPRFYPLKSSYSKKWAKEEYENLKKHPRIKELFFKYNVPCFFINQKGDLILNPRLQDYAFFKVFDSVQTFQRIEMYISNVLVSDTKVDVPVGNDEVIRDSKGFDKYSFRKMKENGK